MHPDQVQGQFPQPPSGAEANRMIVCARVIARMLGDFCLLLLLVDSRWERNCCMLFSLPSRPEEERSERRF